MTQPNVSISLSNFRRVLMLHNPLNPSRQVNILGKQAQVDIPTDFIPLVEEAELAGFTSTVVGPVDSDAFFTSSATKPAHSPTTHVDESSSNSTLISGSRSPTNPSPTSRSLSGLSDNFPALHTSRLPSIESEPSRFPAQSASSSALPNNNSIFRSIDSSNPSSGLHKSALVTDSVTANSDSLQIMDPISTGPPVHSSLPEASSLVNFSKHFSSSSSGSTSNFLSSSPPLSSQSTPMVPPAGEPSSTALEGLNSGNLRDNALVSDPRPSLLSSKDSSSELPAHSTHSISTPAPIQPSNTATALLIESLPRSIPEQKGAVNALGESVSPFSSNDPIIPELMSDKKSRAVEVTANSINDFQQSPVQPPENLSLFPIETPNSTSSISSTSNRDLPPSRTEGEDIPTPESRSDGSTQVAHPEILPTCGALDSLSNIQPLKNHLSIVHHTPKATTDDTRSPSSEPVVKFNAEDLVTFDKQQQSSTLPNPSSSSRPPTIINVSDTQSVAHQFTQRTLHSGPPQSTESNQDPGSLIGVSDPDIIDSVDIDNHAELHLPEVPSLSFRVRDSSSPEHMTAGTTIQRPELSSIEKNPGHVSLQSTKKRKDRTEMSDLRSLSFRVSKGNDSDIIDMQSPLKKQKYDHDFAGSFARDTVSIPDAGMIPSAPISNTEKLHERAQRFNLHAEQSLEVETKAPAFEIDRIGNSSLSPSSVRIRIHDSDDGDDEIVDIDQPAKSHTLPESRNAYVSPLPKLVFRTSTESNRNTIATPLDSSSASANKKAPTKTTKTSNNFPPSSSLSKKNQEEPVVRLRTSTLLHDRLDQPSDPRKLRMRIDNEQRPLTNRSHTEGREHLHLRMRVENDPVSTSDSLDIPSRFLGNDHNAGENLVPSSVVPAVKQLLPLLSTLSPNELATAILSLSSLANTKISPPGRSRSPLRNGRSPTRYSPPRHIPLHRDSPPRSFRSSPTRYSPPRRSRSPLRRSRSPLRRSPFGRSRSPPRFYQDSFYDHHHTRSPSPPRRPYYPSPPRSNRDGSSFRFNGQRRISPHSYS